MSDSFDRTVQSQLTKDKGRLLLSNKLYYIRGLALGAAEICSAVRGEDKSPAERGYEVIAEQLEQAIKIFEEAE